MAKERITRHKSTTTKIGILGSPDERFSIWKALLSLVRGELGPLFTRTCQTTETETIERELTEAEYLARIEPKRIERANEPAETKLRAAVRADLAESGIEAERKALKAGVGPDGVVPGTAAEQFEAQATLARKVEELKRRGYDLRLGESASGNKAP